MFKMNIKIPLTLKIWKKKYFGWMAQNSVETVRFHKISTPGI